MPNPTSLVSEQSERLETSLHFSPAVGKFMSRYQVEVFGSLLDQHLRTIGALRGHAQFLQRQNTTVDWLPYQNLARRLEDCCHTPYVAFNEKTADISIQEMRCKSRLCPRCSRTRAFQLADKLEPLVSTFDSPRFLTLTIKSGADPLHISMKHLVNSFAKLRRSKLWKEKFGQGFYTIEVTHNRRTDKWHPHIHAIVDGSFIRQKELSAKWLLITGTSNIVDIRMANSKKEAVKYIVKYVSKTQDSSGIPDHKIPEWATAIKNCRMISTFGGARMPKDEDADPDATKDIFTIAPIHHLGKAAADGDEYARDLWDQILHQARKGKIDYSNGSSEFREKVCRDLIDRFKNWIDPPSISSIRPPPEQTAQRSMWDRSDQLGSD